MGETKSGQSKEELLSLGHLLVQQAPLECRCTSCIGTVQAQGTEVARSQVQHQRWSGGALSPSVSKFHEHRWALGLEAETWPYTSFGFEFRHSTANSSFLRVHTRGAAGGGSSTWVPAAHVGLPDWAPDSWFWPDPALAGVGFEEELAGGRSLSLCLSIRHKAFTSWRII